MKPAAWFRSGHDVDGGAGLGGGVGDDVSVVHPDVRESWHGPFGAAQQCRERGPVLHVGRSGQGRDEEAAGVDQRVCVYNVDFLSPSNPRMVIPRPDT
jgi:hypothetical protein